MRHALIGAALVALALAVYSAVPHFGFINFDDDFYFEPPRLYEGLGGGNIRWAFTTFYFVNWHPLTWLSWLVEIELFGIHPGVMHLGNALLHAANGALLYAALWMLTRKAVPSALAAALFAVHPMHVESVAWISERKDVLSVFFGMWTLIAYARYVEQPGLARYLCIVAAFALSLLSKPMLVTLPFVLLLLDYWPTGRHPARSWSRLAWEKAPLFAMSVASCAITWMAQSSSELAAVRTTARFPIPLRLGNAALSYVNYVAKTFVPVNLVPFYPYTVRSGDWFGPAVAAGAVALVSWNAWVHRKRLPFFAVGWAWFVGTLVPVIGIIQVGEQSMADRYIYWPHVGLFVAIAFWVNAAVFENRSRALRLGAAAACAVMVAVLGVLAYRQTYFWKDSLTLWRYALEVSEDNYLAHVNFARAIASSDPDLANLHFGKALVINPDGFVEMKPHPLGRSNY